MMRHPYPSQTWAATVWLAVDHGEVNKRQIVVCTIASLPPVLPFALICVESAAIPAQ